MPGLNTLFTFGVVALLTGIATRPAGAQALAPKRALPVGVVPGCAVSAGSLAQTVRRENAEARRLASQAQEAALVGDRSAARDALRRAATLNPTDERVAYDLGRAHEELADSTSAVSEYCRYLALSPDGREAGDVRARLPRLVPRRAAADAERALERFQAGLSHYDARRFDAAADAFDESLRRAPNALEGLFNRALARAAAGRRPDALRDFEAYLVASPTAEDRAAVVRAIALLRRPVYEPGTAFTRGFLPGFGQFYTDRPTRGVIVLAGVASAIGAAFYERTASRQVPYVDPNGVPVPYTESYKERPYLQPAMAGAAVLTFGAALEAMRYAARSQRGVARVTTMTGTRGQFGAGVAFAF